MKPRFISLVVLVLFALSGATIHALASAPGAEHRAALPAAGLRVAPAVGITAPGAEQLMGGLVANYTLPSAPAIAQLTFDSTSTVAAGWSPAGSMSEGRYGATATLLPSGNVLVAGGQNADSGALASAEPYNPG